MLTSETCDDIIQIKGSVRGAVFQTDAEYVKRYCGQEKFAQLKDALRKLGCAIDYENIKAMGWHPLNQQVLAFRVMQDLFNWQDEDFRKMGNMAPKYSFIVKLLMKFFISAKTGVSQAPQYWTRHYDIGSLKVAEFNEEKKHAIIELYDFKVAPIYCRYLEGYFGQLFSFTLPKQIITIAEPKCMHRGEPYHEYDITWTVAPD